MQNKKNLIITHSYGTNSSILSGLTEHLSKFYNVYFIDLPGFHPDSRPLKKVTFDGYVDYLSKRIKELNLEKYYFCGISFGFFVANSADLGKGCQGIIAAVPFLGPKSIKFNPITRFILLLSIYLIQFTNTYSLFWRMRPAIKKMLGSSELMIDMAAKQIDPKTFIQTGKIVLTDVDPIVFKNMPTVLMINPHDTLVNTKYIQEKFAKDNKNYITITTNVEHQPTTLDTSYYAKVFPESVIAEINGYLG